MSEQRIKEKTKNGKGMVTPRGRENFLKAAIFRNIKLKSEAGEEGEQISLRVSRREKYQSEIQLPNFTRYLESGSKSSNNDEDDSDGGDVGNENSNISSDYEKFVTNSPKIQMNNIFKVNPK